MAVTDDGRWARPAGDAGTAEAGAGWWALPGLVDAHAHLAADELDLRPGVAAEVRKRAFACLSRGTFLVVEKGWCDGTVIATLSSLPPSERPDFEGAARMITTEGGYYPDFAVETDEEGLAEVVASATAEGAGWVKLVGDWPRRGRGAVANFTEEGLATAVQVAHAANARVAIHTMAPQVPSMAVAAGVDSIEHGLFLTEADLSELGRRGGAWVPTVVRMQAVAEMLGRESTGGRLVLDGLANVESLLGSVPAGVEVLAGTDLATEPGDVGREVMKLVERGLDPVRALDAATAAPRRYLGMDAGLVEGGWADAVFFEADPLEDVRTLLAPVAVLRRGRWV